MRRQGQTNQHPVASAQCTFHCNLTKTKTKPRARPNQPSSFLPSAILPSTIQPRARPNQPTPSAQCTFHCSCPVQHPVLFSAQCNLTRKTKPSLQYNTNKSKTKPTQCPVHLSLQLPSATKLKQHPVPVLTAQCSVLSVQCSGLSVQCSVFSILNTT